MLLIAAVVVGRLAAVAARARRGGGEPRRAGRRPRARGQAAGRGRLGDPGRRERRRPTREHRQADRPGRPGRAGPAWRSGRCRRRGPTRSPCRCTPRAGNGWLYLTRDLGWEPEAIERVAEPRRPPDRRRGGARAGGRAGGRERGGPPRGGGQDRDPSRDLARPALAADRDHHRRLGARHRRLRSRAGRADRGDRGRERQAGQAGRRSARPVTDRGRARWHRRPTGATCTTWWPPPAAHAGSEHPIEFALPAELPLVRADAAQLERVFSNLIENAIKFSPAGAPVQDHRRRQLRPGRRAGRRPRQRDPAPLPLAGVRTVLPGPRAASSRVGRRGGSGLGLAICRGFVEANGGRIVLQTGRGHRDDLRRQLPGRSQPASADGVYVERRVRMMRHHARRGAASVDDEPQIVRGLKIILRSAGYTVEAAETKAEALVELASRPPDALVLDLVLAGRPGRGDLRGGAALVPPADPRAVGGRGRAREGAGARRRRRRLRDQAVRDRRAAGPPARAAAPLGRCRRQPADRDRRPGHRPGRPDGDPRRVGGDRT